MRQIALDTETTGLLPQEGHRIIEIGCVELIHRQFTGNNFHCYLNPERLVDGGALAVHGLTNEFLTDKPTFSVVVESLLDYIKDAELIIHNAPFDVGFLDHEFKLLGKSSSLTHYCTVFDSLVMARQKHPGQKNSLDALCRRYNIDNAHRQLHGALLDAELLAKVYLAMTGGQGSLFAEAKHDSVKIQEETAVISSLYSNFQLPVIPLSTEDEQAHSAFLEMIEKTSGSVCDWEE